MVHDEPLRRNAEQYYAMKRRRVYIHITLHNNMKTVVCTHRIIMEYISTSLIYLSLLVIKMYAAVSGIPIYVQYTFMYIY